MTTDEQIAAVRAMAEELPGVHHNLDSKTMKFWIWGGKKFQWELHAWRYGVDEGVIKESLATAHRFLCSLKRGVTVDVVVAPDDPNYCYTKCTFYRKCIWQDKGGHGPLRGIHCPGPAPPGMHYELCLMPDDTKEANDAKR